MVEVIYKIVKIFTGLCLQAVSLLLLIWVFSVELSSKLWHLLLILAIGLLVYLFVGFSLTLFYQTVRKKTTNFNPEILDDDEIKQHLKND